MFASCEAGLIVTGMLSGQDDTKYPSAREYERRALSYKKDQTLGSVAKSVFISQDSMYCALDHPADRTADHTADTKAVISASWDRGCCRDVETSPPPPHLQLQAAQSAGEGLMLVIFFLQQECIHHTTQPGLSCVDNAQRKDFITYEVCCIAKAAGRPTTEWILGGPCQCWCRDSQGPSLPTIPLTSISAKGTARLRPV